ncbi:MAG: hypothetical protein ACRC2R_10925 [Xenococcaceae cyanobacterium]
MSETRVQDYWDNWDNKGGKNLRVGIPSLYSTGKYSNGEYYGWTRYDSVQLNLNGFEKTNIGKVITLKKCPN